MGDGDKPGKFTQQFDAEIFKKELAKAGQSKLDKEIEEKTGKIKERLLYRKDFLTDRFGQARAEEFDTGIKILFDKTETIPHKARIEFEYNLNRETLAIHLEFTSDIEGEGEKKDYTILSLKKFDLEKIDNFIESKILQFARHYVQG